jgi:hypothetical protein
MKPRGQLLRAEPRQLVRGHPRHLTLGNRLHLEARRQPVEAPGVVIEVEREAVRLTLEPGADQDGALPVDKLPGRIVGFPDLVPAGRDLFLSWPPGRPDDRRRR